MNYESYNVVSMAAKLAEQAHAGQKRKYVPRPYIDHPASVAARMIRATEHPYVVAAAWLHDVGEDCPAHFMDLIRSDLGETVWAMVNELTNQKHDKGMNRTERKMTDRRRLARVSDDVKRIKLADRTDNLWSLVSERPGSPFLELYLAESELLYHEALVDVHPQLERELLDVIAMGRETFVQKSERP